MSIGLDVRCDECNKRLEDGDEVICVACHELLKEEIDKLNERIEKLETALDEATA